MVLSAAELGRTLRERRRALGLTRMRLAERTGFASADLAHWERGDESPDPDQVMALADAVGLDDEQTQAWLDAVVTVDITAPEIEVEIVEGSEPRANPFSLRTKPLRSESSRLDRLRHKVGDLGRVAPAPAVGGDKSIRRRPAPSARTGLVAAPIGRTGRELPSVFPESQIGSYDPSVRVYSTEPSAYPGPGDEQVYLLRRIRTAGTLIVLGMLLWWAIAALGEGLGDVLDLFQAPVGGSLIP